MATCYCQSPTCPKQHSQSGTLVMRADFFTYWYALSALMRWDQELQDKPDDESRQANAYVKRAIGDLEVVLFGRSETEVAADWRALRSEMAKAADA